MERLLEALLLRDDEYTGVLHTRAILLLTAQAKHVPCLEPNCLGTTIENLAFFVILSYTERPA